jgi:hypothetical protein
MNTLMNDLLRHRREFLRNVEGNRYERTSTGGIYVPSMGLIAGGQFTTWLNGGDKQIDDNLLPTEGLNYLLDVADGGTQIAAWYIGLFSGNYTPIAAVTGATWVAAATEFEDYDESTRREWVAAAASAGAKSNAASLATFTIAAGVEDEILYGAALVQASAKNATTGKIKAISRFGSQRTVNATDVLSIQYTLSVTSS